jgi:sugar lactone lactonase YvrE
MLRILTILLLLPLSARSQIITTVAGNGVRGYNGDSSLATAARLNQPIALAIDGAGNIYVADVGVDNIRKIAADGIITTIAGDRHREGSPQVQDVEPCSISDGGPAVAAMVWKPHGIATDRSGNIYFTENCGNIRRISSGGIITTIAGDRKQVSNNKDADLAINAKLSGLNGIAIDTGGNIYFDDEGANKILKISRNGMLTTIAGNGKNGYSGDGEIATSARLNKPWGVAVDDAGNMYITDNGNERIRKVNAAGIITTIAGTGEKGYEGDRGLAVNATFNDPRGIAVDHYGNVYIADSRNDAVRKIDTNGIITTFAGNGRRLYHIGDVSVNAVANIPDEANHGNGGPATKAQLYWPCDVALDRDGNLYIADDQNHVVRKVNMPAPLPKKTPIPQTPPKEVPKEIKQISDAFKVSADAESETLTIATDSGAYVSLTITDLNENILIQQPIISTRTIVDISKLPPARYFINMQKEDKTKTKTAMFVKDR